MEVVLALDLGNGPQSSVPDSRQAALGMACKDCNC
jgi:hypothetical protein